MTTAPLRASPRSKLPQQGGTRSGGRGVDQAEELRFQELAARPAATEPVEEKKKTRLTIALGFEQTHLQSRTTREDDVVSTFRGGTLWLGTAELRLTPFGGERFGPFAVAGVAAGVSHPNVNDVFPNRVSNGVRAMFFGGGLNVPIAARVHLFTDARMVFGAEGDEGIVAVAPLRAGIAWRF